MSYDSKMITFEQAQPETQLNERYDYEESNFHFDNVCTTFLTHSDILNSVS